MEVDHLMYKLLLVDDEPWVLYHLTEIISWKDYGFQICAKCESGFEALTLLDTMKPDALLTDIRMDGMSGLELIRKAREKLPNLEFIILSAYSDFQVAREALVLDVSQYLIKPLMKNDIIDAALRLRQRIQKNNSTIPMNSPVLEHVVESCLSSIRHSERKCYVLSRDNRDLPSQVIRLPIVLQEYPDVVLICCREWISTLISDQSRYGMSRYRLGFDNLSDMIQEALNSERYEIAFQEKSSIVDDAQCLLMKRYWDSNILSTLSAQLYVSDVYLRKLFSKYVKASPSNLLKHIRIREASFLLKHTTEPIREISERIGYSDYNYFSRVFKKETGVSPEAFRNQYSCES